MIYANLKDAINHYVVTSVSPTKITGYRLNTLLNDMFETLSLLGLHNTLVIGNETLGKNISISDGDFLRFEDGLFAVAVESDVLNNNYIQRLQPKNGLIALTSDIPATTVTQTITNGVTVTSPSENAVFDALALKVDVSSLPLTYKALLSQNAPIASQTSGVFVVGQIWEILDYKSGVTDTYDTLVGGTGYTTSNGVPTTGGTGIGLTVDIVDTAGVITGLIINAGGTGYTVGDVITVTTGNADATFNVTATLSDDFSNMELISGTMNTTGAFIRATSTTPTDWSNGSDLTYDGSPYVVSTDANGDLNPFVNTTLITPTFSYNVGLTPYYLATFVGLFPDMSKVSVKLQNSNTGVAITTWVNDVNSVGFNTVDITNSPNTIDNSIYYTPIEIEIYP